MEELLRLDSTRLYGNNNQICGFFHIFDAYQRREDKRMPSYQRLGGRQHGVGSDILLENDEAGSGGDTMADKGAINVVENKARNMNKSSGKAGILNFIVKKLLKRQKHKGKMSHSPTQLMCTTSIHPLESSDYGTPGELGQMTSDSETSTIALCLDESYSPATSEHESLIINGLHGSVEGKQRALEALNTTGCYIGSISHKLDEMGNHLLDEHIILKEKLFEARDALLKQKDLDPKGMTVEFLLQSKIFLDTLHLLNTNREALYNVCRGQNSSVANAIQTFVPPAKVRASNRSVSLNGLELSRNAAGIPIPSRKQTECDEFINQGSESGSVDLLTKTFGAVLDIEVLPGSSLELRKQGQSNTILSRLRQLKQKLKGVIVENKKEHRRISMDRILDKVPSGKKPPEDVEDDKLHLKDGPVSGGGQGFKLNRVAPGSSIEKFANNGIQRSRSLTESLDRYSQLFDYISSNEVRKTPERSNSIREGSGLQHTKLPKAHRRMPSNPAFLSTYSFIKDVRSDENIAFQSSKKLTLEPLDIYLAPTASGSDKLNKDLVMNLAVEETVCEQERSLESIIVTNAVKANVSDEFVAPTVETSITETKGHERYIGYINECQTVPFQFSKNLKEKNDLFSGQGSQIEDEPNVEPEKTSPISVLDNNIEVPLSPLKFTAMSGSHVQQLQENLGQSLPCTKAWNDVDFNELNIAELSKPNFYDETGTTIGDEATCFRAHVDNKDAARFNYVKHILRKGGYEVLLCETEDSSVEVDAASYMLCDMPFEEQLIYDLINEVLLEIYEHSTVPSSWLSRFHSKIRSMPTGSYLLEEVWAEIRWHISSPQELDTMVDKILARNFTKTDDWMNLYRDAECFGLLLEQLILDDLVDEVIFDID